MLKIRVIKAVAPRVRYFLRSAALSDSEKVGHWHGAAAAAGIDSSRPVSEADFAKALLGFAPDGTYLGRQRKANRRAGWDVVLSPHKSISIAALCLPAAISEQVREAYRDAIRATLHAMEALACRCDGQRPPVPTGNLIVATFTHERSRRNDPHLHTHCIVINATRDTAGNCWRGLEPAPLFRHNLLLDGAFQRELHRQLTIRGFPVGLDDKNRATLPVPAVLIARLSSSKRAIDEAVTTPPPALVTIRNRDNLRALLNDRLRPPKTPPLTSLESALSHHERRDLARRLRPSRPPRIGPAPQPTDLAQRVEAHYRRATLWPASKALFRAVLTAAHETLAAPLDSFLRALGEVRAPGPMTQRPRPPAAVLASPMTPSLLVTPHSPAPAKVARPKIDTRTLLTRAKAAAKLRAARLRPRSTAAQTRLPGPAAVLAAARLRARRAQTGPAPVHLNTASLPTPAAATRAQR